MELYGNKSPKFKNRRSKNGGSKNRKSKYIKVGVKQYHLKKIKNPDDTIESSDLKPIKNPYSI